MATTGSLNHIDISIGYPDRSIPFYHAFFEALGYRRWEMDGDWAGDSPRRATWSIKLADGAIFCVEVRPSSAEKRDRRTDRYEPGPHHLAFNAASPADVRRVHAAMLAVDATVLDPPTDYSGQGGYSDGYYAAFFADPDNLKLEVVHIPPRSP